MNFLPSNLQDFNSTLIFNRFFNKFYNITIYDKVFTCVVAGRQLMMRSLTSVVKITLKSNN